jgi:hypothetical protein
MTLKKQKGGGGSRTHEITVLQTVALGHLATPPNFLIPTTYRNFSISVVEAQLPNKFALTLHSTG